VTPKQDAEMKKKKAKKFRVWIGRGNISPDLHHWVDEVLHGENLLQTILHVHLILELALNALIKERLKRPEVLDDGQFGGRWSFHQKIGLYVALCDPGRETEKLLIAFNKLRNKLSHKLGNEESFVEETLPWADSVTRPPPRDHVRLVTMMLFFDLQVMRKIARVDLEEMSVDSSQ
jgi:hypothetical protein